MRCARPHAILAFALGLTCLAGCGSGGGGGDEDVPVPTVTGVTPSSGWVDAGASLTVHGSGFGAGALDLWIGGAPALDVQRVDDRTCACTSPLATLQGPADVLVTTGGGSSTGSGLFTYFRWPPRFSSADIRLNSGSPGVAACTMPRICCDGPNVYVVWREIVFNDFHVYFNRSTDGGLTWLAHDVRLDTDAAVLPSPDPQICCEGSNVYVVWSDARGLSPDVYLTRSTDGGETWLAEEVRLVTAPEGAGGSGDPRICCDGPRVYVAWTDSRDGPSDVYFNRSLDHGATWLPSDVRLNTDAPGTASKIGLRICCSGSDVYAAWLDWRDGESSIRLNRSTSSGTSWFVDDVRVDTDVGALVGLPDLCCDDARVCVMWTSIGGDESRIYFNRSLDAGSTWLPADVRLDDDTVTDSNADSPRVRSDGEVVHAVFRESNSEGFQVYHRRSLDGGTTWVPGATRVNNDAPGFGSGLDVQLCVSGSNLVVLWYGTADNFGRFRLNASRDRGAHWLAEDVKPYAGSATLIQPTICCDGARAYAVWGDFRNGDLTDWRNDIYFTGSRP